MTPRTVRFFSDGTELVGDLFVPDEPASSGRRPGIVLCHGYTGTRRIHLDDIAIALARCGFVTLTFDYSGWGDSAGPRGRLDPFTRVANARASLTFLSLQQEVDPARLGVFGTSYGGAVAIWTAALDERVRCIVVSVAVGHGRRWMRSVRRPDEFEDLLERSSADRAARVMTGQSQSVPRDLVLLPDRESKRIGDAARQGNPMAVTEVPLSFVDDTLSFHPEWVVDRIAPRPILIINSDADRLVPPEESLALYAAAGEPKRLVTLKGFGHYEVYGGEALRQTVEAAHSWYGAHLG